jgi:hypothetical protein
MTKPTQKPVPPALKENAARLKAGQPLKRRDGSTIPPAPQFAPKTPKKKAC